MKKLFGTIFLIMAIVLIPGNKENRVMIKRRAKSVAISFGLLVLFLLVKEFLDERVFLWIGKSLVSSPKPELLFDTLVILVFLFLSVPFCLKLWRGLVPSFTLSHLLAFLAIIYFIYRWDESLKWEWLRFSYFSSIAFIDLLWIAITGQFLLWINSEFKCFKYFRNISVLREAKASIDTASTLNKLKLKSDNLGVKNGSNGFFCDESLGMKGEDLFGYQHYAEKVTERLFNTLSDQSFAIGINGKWGSGKTSFMDLIKRRIDHEKQIVVSFNPWNSRESEGIIDDFFNVLSNSLKPYHGSLNEDFKTYSKHLSNLPENTLTSFLIGLDALVGARDNKHIFESIQSKILNIRKQIIVFIDDLDRLSTTEIREVLRLIRNTANFRNTFFIVAYDRDYIIEAIRDINPRDARSYLEKIFQLEISLPAYSREKIWDDLIHMLEIVLEVDRQNEIDTLNKYTRVKESILSVIRNKRDVNRLLNSMVLNYLPIRREVMLEDFLALEVLRLKFPSVYGVFADKMSIFLETRKDLNSGMEYLVLKREQKGDEKSRGDMIGQLQKLSQPKPAEIRSLEHYLMLSQSSFQLSDLEVINCLSLVKAIFFSSPFGQKRVNENNIRSIRIPSNFQVYFKYALDESDFPQSEFSDVRKSTLDDLKRFYDKCIDSGLTNILINRIRLSIFFDGEVDYINILYAQFYMARKFSKDGNYFTLDIHKDFLRFFEYSEFSLAAKYFTDKEKYKNILLKELNNGQPPYIFEGRLLKGLLERRFHEPLFSLKEIIEILDKYFRSLVNISSELHRELIMLYELCVSDQIDSSDSLHNFSPTETMANFILNEKNFVANMEILIQYNPNNTTSRLDPFIADIFQSDKKFCERAWEAIPVISKFSIVANENNNAEKIKMEKWFDEFREFLNDYQNTDFKWVETNFKSIQVRKIRDRAYISEN